MYRELEYGPMHGGIQLKRGQVLVGVALLAVTFCVVIVGCSSDEPTRVVEPRISEVGQLVSVREFSDGTVEEYEFQGVTFVGDILVSEYEYALMIAEPRFVEGEVLLRVVNGRVLPPSRLYRYFAYEDGYLLTTCTADSVEYCDRGFLYSFRETSNGYGLEPVLYWRTFH